MRRPRFCLAKRRRLVRDRCARLLRPHRAALQRTLRTLCFQDRSPKHGRLRLLLMRCQVRLGLAPQGLRICYLACARVSGRCACAPVAPTPQIKAFVTTKAGLVGILKRSALLCASCITTQRPNSKIKFQLRLELRERIVCGPSLLEMRQEKATCTACNCTMEESGIARYSKQTHLQQSSSCGCFI